MLPALLMSLTATAVAWIFLGNKPIYHVAPDHFHASQLVFAILMGPIIGLVAAGWTRLITAANRLRPKGVGRWFAPLLAFGALGSAVASLPAAARQRPRRSCSWRSSATSVSGCW